VLLYYDIALHYMNDDILIDRYVQSLDGGAFESLQAHMMDAATSVFANYRKTFSVPPISKYFLKILLNDASGAIILTIVDKNYESSKKYNQISNSATTYFDTVIKPEITNLPEYITYAPLHATHISIINNIKQCIPNYTTAVPTLLYRHYLKTKFTYSANLTAYAQYLTRTTTADKAAELIDIYKKYELSRINLYDDYEVTVGGDGESNDIKYVFRSRDHVLYLYNGRRTSGCWSPHLPFAAFEIDPVTSFESRSQNTLSFSNTDNEHHINMQYDKILLYITRYIKMFNDDVCTRP